MMLPLSVLLGIVFSIGAAEIDFEAPDWRLVVLWNVAAAATKALVIIIVKLQNVHLAKPNVFQPHVLY